MSWNSEIVSPTLWGAVSLEKDKVFVTVPVLEHRNAGCYLVGDSLASGPGPCTSGRATRGGRFDTEWSEFSDGPCCL